jgi:AcrR family transcriptional regulator
MTTDGDASHGASRQGQFSEGAVAGVTRAHSSQRDRALRRGRILKATVEVVAERGYAGASVGLVVARARVSRRTFDGLFADLEQCLVAVLDGALERAAPLVVEEFAQDGPWQEGMRGALAAMLDFFDEEPALARVCLVELGAATPLVRAHRERILAAFAGLVLERIEREVSHPSPLAAEGTYASVVGIVGARLTASEPVPLIELLGPLMGIILAPFLDPEQVAREVQRGDELARELHARRGPAGGAEQSSPRAPAEVPEALRNIRAHRARRCLLYVARHPGASSRQVGEDIGVSHRGQLARMLSRLAALGLLVKQTGGPGRPNAWSLTAEGERVALALARQSCASSHTRNENSRQFGGVSLT